LHYFGERFTSDSCGAGCDNCKKPLEKFDAKEKILLVIKAAKLTGQRFGVDHLVDVLCGVMTDYVKSYEHDKLEVFGQVLEEDTVVTPEFLNYWRSVVRQTLLYDYLEKDIDNIGTVKVSDKGDYFLDRPSPMQFSKDHSFVIVEGAEDENNNNSHDSHHDGVVTKSYDEVLFDMLKGLRKKIAKQRELPPYVIFQDPSLEEMATTYPTNMEELAQINGVGMGKARKFGKQFIDLVNKYVEENDIETAAEVVVKSTINKSKIKIFIIQQIDRKVNLDDIAEAKEIDMATLMEEIEHICYSGTKLTIDYYLDQIMDTDRQQDIYDYFMTAETDSIATAMEVLGEDYAEEELRMMRIKFLSEVAL